MTLLNATALATALGVVVPIVIHLHRRRRARVVQWSAMQFLTMSQSSRRRGLTLEHLLLLFVRCCIIVLFALAVAQPLLPAGGGARLFAFFGLAFGGLLGLSAAFVRSLSVKGRLAGSAAAALLLPAALWQLSSRVEDVPDPASSCDLVIVLDETSSMQIHGDGGAFFDQAVDEAQRLVNRLSGSSTVSIVRCGPIIETVAGSRFQNLRAAGMALAELQPAGGGADTAAAMDRALLLADRGDNACRQIVLFTDDQQSTWESIEGSSLVAVTDTPDPPTQEDAAETPNISVAVHLARLPEGQQNVSVARVRVESPVLSVGRPLMIAAELTNHGDRVAEGVCADLSVDGAAVATQSPAVIAPATTKTVRFPYIFTAAGQHVIRVSADVSDAMSDDNGCEVVVTVRPGISVLLVNGNPTTRPGDQAAVLMGLALDPSGSQLASDEQPKEQAPQRPVQVHGIEAEALGEQTSLDEFDIVLLSEVPQLPQRLARRLSEYVDEGGNLWILPDAQANTEFYNSWTKSRLADGLLPAQLQDHLRPRRGEENATLPAIDLTIANDVMNDLVRSGEHDLSQVQFEAWRQVAVNDTAVVGMMLTSGDPLFVEHAVGQGRVLLQTAGPTHRDGNLLHRVSFPVLMHVWAGHLAGSQQDDSSFSPAAELTIPLSDVVTEHLNTVAAETLQLTDAASAVQAVRVIRDDRQMLAHVHGARRAGVYRLASPADAAISHAFAVSRQPEESDIGVTSSRKLSTLEQSCGLQWIASADELTFSGTLEEQFREMAPWLLVGVMCLLAIESLLACWVRQRRAVVPSQSPSTQSPSTQSPSTQSPSTQRSSTVSRPPQSPLPQQSDQPTTGLLQAQGQASRKSLAVPAMSARLSPQAEKATGGVR